MARDVEALKIRPWAENGDRIDPDDSTLSPALDRAIGWTSAFSPPGTQPVRREVINQMFFEFSSMLDEINTRGLLEWDDGIAYVHPAQVYGSDNRIYVSIQNSTNVNPVNDTNDSHWAPLINTTSGRITPPPDASTTVKGLNDLATNAEALTGTVGKGIIATALKYVLARLPASSIISGTFNNSRIPVVTGLRGIVVSTSGPSGGYNGDLWFQRES